MAGNGKTLEHVCFILKRNRMFVRDVNFELQKEMKRSDNIDSGL